MKFGSKIYYSKLWFVKILRKCNKIKKKKREEVLSK